MFSSHWLYCVGLVTFLLGTAPVHAGQYTQAPGSVLAFATSYDGQIIVGTFQRFQTQLTFDANDLDHAKLDVSIALNSGQTGNAERDSTLKGKDFFNAEAMATAHYTADHFRALDHNHYAINGTLELNGIRRPVPLTMTLSQSNNQVTLRAKGSIPRLAFNIGRGEWADTQLIPNAVAVNTKVFLHSSQPTP